MSKYTCPPMPTPYEHPVSGEAGIKVDHLGEVLSSALDWEHRCAHLAVINEARALLGETPEEGHAYDDAPGEMHRLADERARRCMPTGSTE